MIRKDTEFSRVRVAYDGRVHKTYRRPNDRRRCETEGPTIQLHKVDEPGLTIVTTNCCHKVDSGTRCEARGLRGSICEIGRERDRPPYLKRRSIQFAQTATIMQPVA